MGNLLPPISAVGPPPPLWLDELDKTWNDLNKSELQKCMEVGKLFIRMLNFPMSQVPKGGREYFKQASKRLGLPQTELKRMWWFAERFKNLNELKKKHPDVGSWVKLKERLPGLNPNEG